MRKLTPTNNFKFLHPEIAKEFHPTKNGGIKPENLLPGSNKTVWWLCSKNNNHEYETDVYHRIARNQGCPFCSGAKASKENNIKILFPHLIKEWHPIKNGDLKPEELLKGSHKIIWWICSKGHEWKTIAKTRTISGNNCPFCANQMVGKDNNLKFLFPEIAKEWHPTKNGDIKPEDIVSGSNKKYWWLCRKGHSYNTRVEQRTRRNVGCSKCSNQTSRPEFRIVAELESIFKKVSSRYKFKKTEIDIYIEDINLGIEYDGAYHHKKKDTLDSQKNIFLKNNLIKLIRVRRTPLNKLSEYDVLVYQDEIKKKDLDNLCYSISSLCNEEQKIKIKKYLEYSSFVNEESYRKYLSYFPGPIPSQSLAVINPQLTKQWNYKKNYPLEPESFYPRSNEKVWWICDKGHEWKASITNRSRKNSLNCPTCIGHYSTLQIKDDNLHVKYPIIAREWHPTKNGELKPENVAKNSSMKIWWICPKGHAYLARVSSRTGSSRNGTGSRKGTGCLKCYNMVRRGRNKK